MSAYVPPKPGFVPCAYCGCPTLIGQEGEALTPVLGETHLCGETCACQWAGVGKRQ
jgi:hypothetical protein